VILDVLFENHLIYSVEARDLLLVFVISSLSCGVVVALQFMPFW